MRRLIFASLIASGFPRFVFAQRVPGRELFEFPVGTLAEAPALALHFADGFRNPASILLPAGTRGRAGVSALSTGSDQGATSQTATLSADWLQTTFGVSVTRAAVEGILQTTVDPEPTAGSLPYSTVVVSALAARRTSRHVTTGLAFRYISGRAGDATRGEVGLDGGVVADRLPVADARLAVSTFMWRPAVRSGDGAAYNGAADARIYGDSVRELRAGVRLYRRPGVVPRALRLHGPAIPGTLRRPRARKHTRVRAVAVARAHRA